MSEFLQFLFSGLTVGAVYAMVALGFTLIYNASDVVNFAQGEFVMIGGMATVFAVAAGVPLPLAALLAIAAAVAVGLLLNALAIEPARGASAVTLIIITIGASIFLRGLAQVLFDKQAHGIRAFSGDEPIIMMGAAILPQSLWVLGGGVATFLALYLFLERTVLGKAMLATAANQLAAQLVGINTRIIMMIAFAAAMLGGIGSPFGAMLGGLLLGLFESFSAGYLSSAYKDAVAFLTILVVLFLMPSGLVGRRSVERV